MPTAVLIVNCRGYDDLERCLGSLAPCLELDDEVTRRARLPGITPTVERSAQDGAPIRRSALLIVGHPGHELRVHGWLEAVRPLVMILTDGSGASGASRLASSDALIARAGARPEEMLGSYDLVFAKARCALEALATGAAVVVCDAMGMASLVTTRNLDELGRKNFGRRALEHAVSTERVAAEINGYDPDEAARVTTRVRDSKGLSGAVRSLVDLFRGVVAEFRAGPVPDWEVERGAVVRFLESTAPFANTWSTSERVRAARQQLRETQQKLFALENALATPALAPAESRQIPILSAAGPDVVLAGQRFQITVDLRNDSPRVVAGYPPAPVSVSYHWLRANKKEMVLFEGLRTPLVPPLAPHARRCYVADVLAPERPGAYGLRVTLVQDSVAWFDTPERGVAMDVSVTVI